MARKKSISDDELIHLFEQYLISQCSCDLSLVKIPRFGDESWLSKCCGYNH